MATTFELVLPLQESEYRFRLWHRVLDMGAAGPVRYLWFDLRDFRRGGRDFRTAVDYWWDTTAALAAAGDRVGNELSLVLAELFPMVAASQGCQRVLKDVLLGTMADLDYSLPDQEWQRLLALAVARDSTGVRREFEDCLVGHLPPRDLMPRYQEALRCWTIPAIREPRQRGRPALREFLVTQVVPRIEQYRRRGGQEHVRTFINALAHECKAAAYHCYAAAWRALLAILYHVVHLDDRSARLNWLWHSQQDNDAGQDVFRGMILALHPLSNRIMTQPQYRVAVGSWLIASEKTCSSPWVGDYDCQEYWVMMAAIAASAREYADIRDLSNARRLQSRSARSIRSTA